MRTLLPALLLVSGCWVTDAQIEDAQKQEQDQIVDVPVDILVVMDNSLSMFNESAGIALMMDQLFDPLLEAGVDLTVGITTTSVDPGKEEVAGEVGTLVGSVMDDQEALSDTFEAALLCDIAVWPGGCKSKESEDCVPYVPDYVCGDDPGGVVSWEYLDCVCGKGWTPANPGSGNEEQLEAAFLAMCRAVEDPPPGCYEKADSSPFDKEDILTNQGLLRADTLAAVLIVTDEGDTSGRLAQGEEDIALYTSLFDSLGVPILFEVIGPDYYPKERIFNCNSGQATTWGTIRLQSAAEQTGGLFSSIEYEDEDKTCKMADFSTLLPSLAANILEAVSE